MKKLLLLVSIFFLSITISQAQEYDAAIGARLGLPLSASYKHFLNDSHALEAFVGFRGFSNYSWFSINGAYLVHNPISDVPGLQWYFGGGANLFFWTYDTGFITGENSSNISVGVSGYLGLDYRFAEIPLNLSLDWAPIFFLNGFGSGFGAGYGSLGVRYILGE